ncbi:MAG TPA: hypothetical protein VMB72_14150, partial [Acidimicrobiales bacterium]|nr:hypothetical protein [Acidimicrobiales bacterium]
GSVVAYTVPYDRDGAPQAAIALVEMGGRRTVARGDAALSAALVEGDGVGRAVVVTGTDGAPAVRDA